MSRLFSFSVVLLFAAGGWSQAQAPADYSQLTLRDMIDDGTRRVEEMQAAVQDVGDMRSAAESAEDASAYQRLNNIYTQMNGRLLIAEEALANVRAGSGAVSSLKGTKQSEGGGDRAFLEHNYGLIVAAYNSVMSSYREAQSIMNTEGTAGDGTSVSGGAEDLPDYDVTERGSTVNPLSNQDPGDSSEFQGATPSGTL